MSFTVGNATANPITALPQTLTDIPLYNENDAVNSASPRPFEIVNGAPLATINGASMDINVINETIHMGDLEVWEITNLSGVAHPFHIHGAPFQVLSRSNGPVPDNEKGWKDVVLVPAAQGMNNPGMVKIIKPFLDFADDTFPYMYHCHILEHEDRGMMGQFVVIDTTTTSINEANQIISNIKVFPNPVNDQKVQIEFTTNLSDEYSFSLINQYGQVVKTFYQNKTIVAGSHKLSIDLEEISSGFYFVLIESSQVRSIKKLVKL